jgi:hypothetical protein
LKSRADRFVLSVLLGFGPRLDFSDNVPDVRDLLHRRDSLRRHGDFVADARFLSGIPIALSPAVRF